MAGILDKKERFIDLVITQEGKRQIAEGMLRAEYASLSDVNSFYEKNQTMEEVSKRIYFQVSERRSNSIVLEKDDSGRIIQNDIGGFTIVGTDSTNNQLFVQTKTNTGKIKDSGSEINIASLLYATGSQFASLSKELSKKSLEHFKNNRFIGTQHSIEHKNFNLSKENINFSISNSIPFKTGPKNAVVNVNNADSFLTDYKMAHLPVFQFLPPINEDRTAYGEYEDVRSTKQQEFEDIIKDLGIQSFQEVDYEESDRLDTKKNTLGDAKVYNRENLTNIENFNVKEYEYIKFTDTSLENNLLIQVFETNQNNNTFTKLDIIDAGYFLYENDVNERYEKQVYHVGKVYFDDYNTPTFINIFTIIFD